MVSVTQRSTLEEVSSYSDDDSSSLSAYATFNSLGMEDSLERTRRLKKIDSGHKECTDSGVEERPAWCGKLKSCCFKCMDITATVVVIFIIWMVMALPTAFYAIHIREVVRLESIITDCTFMVTCYH